jgi:glucoamylase
VHAGEVLRLPNGGILPGQDWRGDRTQAWTAETAMFALAAAATGRVEEADRWLRWIYDHRSALGAFPEKVDPDGRPASVAPVAWADAGVLLSLRALEHPLDVPPDPC